MFDWSSLKDYAGLLNYWVVIVLMMSGFYVVIAQHNMIKKIVGLNIFRFPCSSFISPWAKSMGALPRS